MSSGVRGKFLIHDGIVRLKLNAIASYWLYQLLTYSCLRTVLRKWGIAVAYINMWPVFDIRPICGPYTTYIRHACGPYQTYLIPPTITYSLITNFSLVWRQPSNQGIFTAHNRTIHTLYTAYTYIRPVHDLYPANIGLHTAC